MKEELEKRIKQINEKLENVFDETQNVVGLMLKRDKLIELLWLFTD